MSEEKRSTAADHAERVAEAFGQVQASLGGRVGTTDSERLADIRDALAAGDVKAAGEKLASTKLEASWLYEELMEHPAITAIMQELSLLGF